MIDLFHRYEIGRFVLTQRPTLHSMVTSFATMLSILHIINNNIRTFTIPSQIPHCRQEDLRSWEMLHYHYFHSSSANKNCKKV